MAAIGNVIRNFKESFIQNPVFLKELRIGLREKKVFIIQSIYLLVIGIVAFIFLMDASNKRNYQAFQEVGENYFRVLCIVQWFLVVLVSPSFTSAALSSEKEKKTYDMLLLSLLSPAEIILGKIAYAGSYIFLLLMSSLPLVAIVFFLGGVSPLELVVNYIALFVWGVLVCTIALFFSSKEHRSAMATNQTYGLLILAGIFIVPVYIGLFWEKRLFIGYSFKFPEMLLWGAVYFNILWGFLFFFYKIANNIRPKASHVLALHRLFILGFLLNILMIPTGLLTLSSNQGSGFSFDQEALAGMWTIFILAAVFCMGCFIERHRFLSQKEEKKLNKSISSKPSFFPLYFIGVSGMILFISNLTAPKESNPTFLSAGLFILYLMTMIGFTSKLYQIFRKKIRPVYLYFGLFLTIILLPLFTWFITQAFGRGGGSHEALPLLSGVFINPIFSIMSIWQPKEEFGLINFFGTNLPTYYVTVGFFIMSYLFLFILGRIVDIFQLKKK